ncbi:MAG: DUF5060 domain-containing protein [Opitutaceae bacterium]|nr:DUF5060 domain-containing protein [Opitutaceae bacterium]
MSFRCLAVGLAFWALPLVTALPVPSAPFRSGAEVTTEQWQPFDLVFSAPTGAGHPFDVEFSAAFTGPAGEKLIIPGFFDGPGRTVLRFAPPRAGRWTFTTASAVPGLNQLSGAIRATAAGPGRHGPLGIDPKNPRQFAHADGTPSFPIAFEADWLFALDAENPAGIPKTVSLVRHIAANGFNQVVMNVYAYDVTWPRDHQLDPAHDYGRPRIFPFGGDNTNPDFSTLNVAFFQHLDRVIAHLDQRGLIAHLMIYVWNKQVSWPAARSAEDNRYFDYIVKRYQAFPNMLWDVSKEATGYGRNDMPYIAERAARLRALDAGRRLVTVHDYGYCSRYPDTVDFISIQTWASELWHVMMDVRAKHPTKPILNIEHGGYERGPIHVFTGSYLDPEVCLERAYQIVFAGAFPTHYWQDTSWNVVIHDPSVLPEADRPRLHYYRHLATLAARYGFTGLEPEPRRSNNGFCLSNQRDLFVYLVPRETSAFVVRPPKEAKGTLHATWFDPFSGASRMETPRPIGSDLFFTPPAPGRMAVLIVRLAPGP